MVPKSLFNKRNRDILPNTALLPIKIMAIINALDLAMVYGAIAFGFIEANNYPTKLRMFGG